MKDFPFLKGIIGFCSFITDLLYIAFCIKAIENVAFSSCAQKREVSARKIGTVFAAHVVEKRFIQQEWMDVFESSLIACRRSLKTAVAACVSFKETDKGIKQM